MTAEELLHVLEELEQIMTATLEEMLAQAQEANANDGLMTWEQYWEYREHQAELEAENAWLRAAENAGWEEAYTESLRESGLIV